MYSGAAGACFPILEAFKVARSRCSGIVCTCVLEGARSFWSDQGCEHRGVGSRVVRIASFGCWLVTRESNSVFLRFTLLFRISPPLILRASRD